MLAEYRQTEDEETRQLRVARAIYARLIVQPQIAERSVLLANQWQIWCPSPFMEPISTQEDMTPTDRVLKLPPFHSSRVSAATEIDEG